MMSRSREHGAGGAVFGGSRACAPVVWLSPLGACTRARPLRVRRRPRCSPGRPAPALCSACRPRESAQGDARSSPVHDHRDPPRGREEPACFARSGAPMARPVILKVIDPRRGCSQDIERLRREYAIEARCSATRPSSEPLAPRDVRGAAGARHGGFRRRVARSPPPIDAPMSAGRFLDLAVRLVTCVAELHQRDILHKDLKPQNILVNATTGEVKLADFGLASRLPASSPRSGPPRLIEGSLPYLSPEQTGRMNRAIDSRAPGGSALHAAHARSTQSDF